MMFLYFDSSAIWLKCDSFKNNACRASGILKMWTKENPRSTRERQISKDRFALEASTWIRPIDSPLKQSAYKARALKTMWNKTLEK